jgi:hypothetical protein
MMMVDNILGNSNNVSKEKVCIVFLIEMFIWEHGKMINLMEKDYMYMRMVKDIKESFKMGENQEEGFIYIKAEPNMMVNGKKIKKMDSVYFFTQTIKNMKAIGLWAKRVEKEHTISLLVTNILGNG